MTCLGSEKGENSMTLESFVKNLEGRKTFNIYMDGEPVVYDGRYDYMVLEPEEWESVKGPSANGYEPECMSAQDWWSSAKDCEVVSWNVVERGREDLLILVWLQ